MRGSFSSDSARSDAATRAATCGRVAPGVAALVQVSLAFAVLLASSHAAAQGDEPNAPAGEPVGESLIAPLRRGGYPFVSADAFAFAGDGSVVGGSLAAGYAAAVPFRAEIGVEDFAVAEAGDGSQRRASFLAYAGLDTQLFGFGPSGGYQAGHKLDSPLFGAALRAGAIDGLHLQARGLAGTEDEPTLYPAAGPVPEPDKRVVLAELDIQLQVPVARGGHGALAELHVARGPFARLALGYRGCLSKPDRRDSSWIEVKLGVGLLDSTFAQGCHDCQTFIAGPLFGIGFEKRF